jgi:hypothetical protein
MAVFHRSLLGGSLAAAATLVAGLASAQAPRISGSSVGVEAKRFDARVLIANDSGNKVAKVVFAMQPRCPGDPNTAKYASVPEVTAQTATQEGANRAFAASIPDPSDGAFGAWTVRSTALDASGTVIGRHQTQVVRTFQPKFKSLAFESATLDTSSGPATAKLVIDLDHDAAITSVGLVTSLHDNPVFGYATLPGELAQDRAAGVAPWLTSRIEQKAPSSLVGQFGFPASTPPMTFTIKRIFMADARCRTAELAPPKQLSLAVKSSAPRALPVDVRLDRTALAKNDLVVAFRLLGPAPRSAPAPEIGGQKAPIVAVSFLDSAPTPRVLGSTAARPIPSVKVAEQKWDGETMATTAITIPSGPTALGEALKKGLTVEIDDGGKPLAPRVVLRGP